VTLDEGLDRFARSAVSIASFGVPVFLGGRAKMLFVEANRVLELFSVERRRSAGMVMNEAAKAFFAKPRIGVREENKFVPRSVNSLRWAQSSCVLFCN